MDLFNRGRSWLSFSCFSSPGREIAFIILYVSSSIFLLPLSESIDFEITSFVSNAKNIIYSGDAEPTSGAIELTRVDIVRVGHAKYADAVQIWDKKSGKLSDFTTHFTFIIDTLN
ncbi:putative legume lectin domain, concanavalin A-like lectin/glucanase domain superfamily [Helianthus annuus]|uniref:Legume lectin domain, concanavalin A-like lectin/glucanase domain superfamily n=1 Tax=Helianthus annuus TaxID=4232 RepID=A0A9K3EJL5_HELAN|nr:putative legume lectin domain, concanavalin A-like lectin/glucanase domain superfamily [Helianthus annuus]KAJ0477821.1 putative legume lectin domain, concanavalin A-like lectin/glucanase domain superfamily [Helianthus annuus]KAJ0482408.1 putative legume lectin domain, concanavalin A-like lectin/glucanase domain superfamily [Helianthus annuus]KAJ0498653.1 putative legume lectin domain, concanavalin A-like lectin/glucanase domain superfamily [Helianthus annuus]KAJ0664666.1 putative legume lect